MEDEKNNKRYKAVSVDLEGPFDGWIIEEMDPSEYKDEPVVKADSSKNGKVSAADVEKKRQEQLAKIKALIEKKKQLTAATNSPEISSDEALEKKSKDTGIPLDVLKMIEEKKKKLRAQNEANSKKD